MESALERLKRIESEIQHLSCVVSLLGWDQETYMPPAAVQARAEQTALLEGLIHDRIASPEVGDLLAAMEGSGGADSPAQRGLLRETRRAHERAVRVPRELVTEIARQTSLAQACWVEARRRSDFAMFQGSLEQVIRLTIEKAEALGHGGERYDPLLDEYEPWVDTRSVETVFSSLEGELTALLGRVLASGRNPRPLEGSFPLSRQRRFVERILRDLGFDFARGRLDVSAHPFSTTLGPDDIRLTTRFQRGNLACGLFGAIHECGHGLYEQGIAAEHRGTLLAGAASLGIHESQSRFWENMVARSAAFWRLYYEPLRSLFPRQLADFRSDDFYGAVNRVEASPIRIEADELTYSLHIILRFNLERRLISGSLAVADLPDAWRVESARLLGIVPRSDAEGVLQDIHWSMGAFGYFPTYALGNLYAAQFRAAMQRDLGDLDAVVEAGDFAAVLDWLRRRIHMHGRVYTASELCERATGRSLAADDFLRYLENKFGAIYGV